MKIDPVRYRMLIMQLMMPTPMNALRHERRASPSSDRPGMAAIKNDLFEKGGRDSWVLPMFRGIVHLRRINPKRGRKPAKSRRVRNPDRTNMTVFLWSGRPVGQPTRAGRLSGSAARPPAG